MRKYLNLWLLAALLCGMSLSVTSCKDDDNDSNDSEEQQGEESQDDGQEASLKFWSVVGQLVSMADATADYKDKRFEPIIGVEGDEPGTRIVYTNSAAAAAERFANLVDASDVSEETASRQWSDPDVGTLNYTKVTDGTAWATVDVDIDQVPHLSRIIYRAPSQGDHNGGVAGNRRAYYRFGDVIERKNKDNMTEYWICVRPAFDPEGKGDSHWITVSPLPTTNQYVKHYKYDNDKKNIHAEHTYVLPTMLTTEEEHMQNLAELLYAIFNPAQWYDNVQKYSSVGFFGGPSGLKIFHDFNKKNVNYHNASFWLNVQAAWRASDLCTKLFGFAYDDMKKLVNNDGIYMLYKGYSWKSGNAPLLWQAHYYNTPGGVHANMQTAKPYSDVRKAVYNKENPSQDIEFDITKECSAEQPYLVKPEFFGDSHPRFIVRTATGAELSLTRKYPNNEDNIPGITKDDELYRYYDLFSCGVRDDEKPEVTPKGFEDRAYYAFGDIVKDNDGNRWICVQPSGHGNEDAFGQMPYSYFVSFDEKAVGRELENIPRSKELAAQILFGMSAFYYRYINYADVPDNELYRQVDNIRQSANVNMDDIIATRDTLHKFSVDSKPGHVYCTFVSGLYRETNGDIRVLRLVEDHTAEQSDGKRDWLWRFYTHYIGSDFPMELTDLSSESFIPLGKNDRWINLPWFNVVTKELSTANTGPLTKSEDVSDLSRFIYVPGNSVLNGDAPATIYREPLIAFSVQRVLDNGQPMKQFGSGVWFGDFAMMRMIDENFLDDDATCTEVPWGPYMSHTTDNLLLEEKYWPFGMANKTNE